MITAAVAFFYSCSTTRRIPQGEYLYTGLKGVDFVADTIGGKPYTLSKGVKEVITEAVDVLTTKKWPSILPLLPVGLWVYNNISDSATGIKGKIYESLAKEPVTVSDVRPELRAKMLDQILDNNGYFQGSASYELIHPKNPKKASILYTVHAGKPYPIDSLIMLPDTTELNHMIDSMASGTDILAPCPVCASAWTL